MELDELFNNPYYWNNNKRRYNGLKPIRNNKKRIKKITHSTELFNAISTELEEQVLKAINNSFSKFVDIKDINMGDAFQ